MRNPWFFGRGRVLLLCSCVLAWCSVASAGRFEPLGILRVSQELPHGSTETSALEIPENDQRQPPLSTELRDLAAGFRAAKPTDGGIHVGRLLEACEKLAAAVGRIGFQTNAKDLRGNIGKIRTLYDRSPQAQRDSLPELLLQELADGVHGPASGRGPPSLKDPSAAVGVLWLGRAIRFQHEMFGYLLDHPEKEPYDAATSAYEGYLQQHHSWALRKAYRLGLALVVKPMKRTSVLSGLGGFPEESFGPSEAKATSRDLREMLGTLEPLMSEWEGVFADLGFERI